MTGQCQCDWHKLQYCWMCEADFDEHTESAIDSIEDEHQQDAAYFTNLGNSDNPPRLIEMAETFRQEANDYLTELSERLAAGIVPIVTVRFYLHHPSASAGGLFCCLSPKKGFAMLILAVAATLHRMEIDLYSGRVAHVPENPRQHRHRPLSKIEQSIICVLDDLLYGGTKPEPITIPDDVMATMPPLPA